MTQTEAMNMALEWAYSNGETVFAGGGMRADIRIDFGPDGGIYKVEWTNKVLGENT